MVMHSSTKSTLPSEETLRALYSAQWQDLHHSRDQDWRLCNLIIVGLLGTGGLKIAGQFPDLQRIVAGVFGVVCLLAICVTLRHRALFKEKMAAILKIEQLLGVPNLFQKRSRLKRLFKVQYLLMLIYLLFGLFFFCLACSNSGWGLGNG